ncbi:hypothetical protein NM688_g5016 [Phlebia brevispora]|uniref:Uncharacterized protein n=1 Tax=Phlebia brevispora TaxID=194682 RepID=A0ACC1T190_9APHY|nr:hypothetical protein NM688_g5016 [Phlebia brevispora]
MPTDLRRPHPKPDAFEFDLPPSKATSGIIRLTVDIPSSHITQSQHISRPPPRWKTPEFIFYAFVFCAVVPIMIWIPISLSSPSHPSYPIYIRRLSPGWLFGRRVDNSDAQYRGFRNNIPALSGLIVAFFAFKTIYTQVAKFRASAVRFTDNLHHIPFSLAFSMLMLIILHGTSVLKIFAILSINYLIAKLGRGSKVAPVLTWVFNGAVLFLNETQDGYRFSSLHHSLERLDKLGGLDPRWHIRFNITMLRLVSFNMDYYWAYKGQSALDTGDALNLKQRTTIAHPLELYSYRNYVTYVTYAPLFIAGPIMTFNDFMWQLCRPVSVSTREKLGYLFRFVTCFLAMEFILHFMYMVAIKDTKAWYGATAAELCMIGFWNLIIVWLKLLIPWRFFRLWALLDGIDPPENMVRCMANNYSTMGFWRSWHRSYNLWIVRYIYIPLGGTRNVIPTTILVFSFVALWHDLSFRLLAWGWLVSLFILPELCARFFLPRSKYGDRPWYRHVCAVGAVFNILMMMAANLVGFVIGTEGISYLLTRLVSGWEGVRFLLFACGCLFVGAQIMFEYREEEMRQGIYRRC